MSAVFTLLCESLSCNVVLFMPTPSDRFILYTNASSVGVGVCLHADREDEEVPISFYSRQLCGAEKNYSVIELESLAIVSAIKHYNRYLYGQTFTAITDHKPCISVLSSSHLSKRLRRFALNLQNRDVQIVYRPGVENNNADGMSRRTWEMQEDAPPLVVEIAPREPISGGGDVGSETRKKREDEKKEEK